ncbi:MAG: DUF4190 domain-containing protein [Sphingomonadales bacterium]|nr:DUF4190 domain-containing protein [Sphingomonadales bacterium]
MENNTLDNNLGGQQKQSLPNSTATLVMGILSIVFSCFFVGLILGIIGLSISGKGRKMYRANPSGYDGYGALNAGYIMSIIGTIIGSLYTLYYIILVVIIGGTAFSLM